MPSNRLGVVIETALKGLLHSSGDVASNELTTVSQSFSRSLMCRGSAVITILCKGDRDKWDPADRAKNHHLSC